MTLREKIGQLVMLPYFGAFLAADSPERRELLRQVEENHIGGLILSTRRGPFGIERSRVYPTAVVTNELQRRVRVPLLIGADFESGTRMRLEEGTSVPSPMAIAATGDPKLAYAAGAITAREARAVGVHWIFAPDADVNTNPSNPIINFRSFGEDPRRVAEFAAEFVSGAEENGVLACAKHFPGHGNVSVDSHLALPVADGSRSEIESTELVPFRAAIEAGVSSIMPGHLAVPALEPDARIPATLSRSILTDLLRDEMKFRGLIITDALDMGGVASLFPPGEVAVRAIEAGADVLLMPPVPDAAIAALEDAAQSGRISVKRLDASVKRILAAKARLGLYRNRLVDITRLPENFAQSESRAQAQEIADRGVTLLRDIPKLLPLDATKPLRVLLIAISADPDPCAAEAFESEMRARAESLTVLRADTRFAPVIAMDLPAPESYDVAVAALFVRVADRKGHVGIPDDQHAFVSRLLAAGKPVAVVSFGSPYLIERFPGARTWLAEFSTNDVAQRAAARALFGQTAISGKLPVTVPDAAARGSGLRVAPTSMTLEPAPRSICDRLTPAYDLLDRTVADRAFPGGVLAIAWNNHLALHPFGTLDWQARSPRVTAETVYDVSSLTKPIVTTTAAMMLVERKQLDLDTPVSRYLPGFGAAADSDPDAAWRERITPRMLLLHNSGLPAHRDFFERANGKEAVLARVFAEPLVHEPGTRIEYSDLGFILLGEIIERLTGRHLDRFAHDEIFVPLGMNHSLFVPPRDVRPHIAPTENDTTYRKRLIRGEVGDENAGAMGGVAGHAGLFSTAGDIAVFAQMILNGGIYAHRRILSRATVEEFTARSVIGESARALGWDVPSETSASGRYFSDKSYGHLGFTGTSLWIDSERGLSVVLLTNRVHPTRANDKIHRVRPAVHDAVMEALGLASGAAGLRERQVRQPDDQAAAR